MKQLSDFKPGDKVIYHTQKYNWETKSYSPWKRPAVVTKIGDLGVTIELEVGKNPDYNIHVGSLCLDLLEHVNDVHGNVVMLRKKASKETAALEEK